MDVTIVGSAEDLVVAVVAAVVVVEDQEMGMDLGNAELVVAAGIVVVLEPVLGDAVLQTVVQNAVVVVAEVRQTMGQY
jgi:hypothetical protein